MTKKLSKRQRRIAGKQAAKNPAWVNTVAAYIHKPERPKFSRGAASPVRHIMVNGKPVDSALIERVDAFNQAHEHLVPAFPAPEMSEAV